LERLMTCGADILGDLMATSSWMSYLHDEAKHGLSSERSRSL
jgi:hypothetical protein